MFFTKPCDSHVDGNFFSLVCPRNAPPKIWCVILVLFWQTKVNIAVLLWENNCLAPLQYLSHFTLSHVHRLQAKARSATDSWKFFWNLLLFPGWFCTKFWSFLLWFVLQHSCSWEGSHCPKYSLFEESISDCDCGLGEAQSFRTFLQTFLGSSVWNTSRNL